VSVTAPDGFRASGVIAGLKDSGRPDLGLLVADRGASAAGLFTTNAFPAAPVSVSQRHLINGRARAVVINSGQANAATGEIGLQDAETTCAAVSVAIGADPEDVLVCSTGVIGPRVKMTELTTALPAAVGELSDDGGPRFAEAILTTDTVSKETVMPGVGFTVGGCAKGVGMIAPQLATMLAILTTDVEVDPKILDTAMRRSVAPVFNGLTVDGCTSTNDTVLLLASGASGVRADPGTPQLGILEAALYEAAKDLVHQIQVDAEGATKALAVQVTGAHTGEDAARVARGVASSMLVKTAVFGGDPNPGRILQAVGSSGVPIIPGRVSISLAGHQVIAGGVVVTFDQRACAEALKERDVAIEVDLGLGDDQATAFGCDLGYEYIRINAEYTT
jgi:glutamate N-acetyltransferase/amino-acid N-acetyltransferase